jgi:hypothetical protein
MVLLGSNIGYDTGFKVLSRPECRHASGRYGYDLACFWIPAWAAGFITKLEFSKTRNFYLLTLLQRNFNFFKKEFYHFFALRLSKPSLSDSVSAKSALVNAIQFILEYIWIEPINTLFLLLSDFLPAHFDILIGLSLSI